MSPFPFLALGGGSLQPVDRRHAAYWPTWGHLIKALDASPLPYLDTTAGLVLDSTFGRGVFWRCYNPLPVNLITNDLDPDRAAHKQWDWLDETPPDDWLETFRTAIFDPPFKLSGTNRIMLDRYGLDDDAPNGHRTDGLIAGALNVAQTVEPGGYLLTKCQPQVAGGRVRWQPRRLANALEQHGWTIEDELHRQYNPIPQPGNRTQQHARRNYSTLVIARKPTL